MNIRLRLTPSHILVAVLLFSAAGLFSCGKEADPSVIKVSSTPIEGVTPTTPSTGNGSGAGTGTGSGTGTGTGTGSGSGTGTGTNLTINSNGDGGVPVGSTGTIVFNLKGTKYTLTNSGNTYLVAAATLSVLGVDATQLVGIASNPTSNTQFSLTAQTAAAGIYNVSDGNITLKDGTSYSVAKTPVGKINFNTFVTGVFAIVSKGTFDVLLVNDKDATDVQRVSGSFNVQ